MSRLAWIAIGPLAVLSCSGHPRTEPTEPSDSKNTGSAAVVTPPAPPDAPPTLDHDPRRLAERAVGLMRDVAAAFTASGEDCALATGKLADIRQTYADLLTANATMLGSGRAAELKAAVAPRQDDLDAAAAAVFSSKTLPACAHDAAFARAFELVLGGT